MDKQSFLERIKTLEHLPGVAAHQLLMPKGRPMSRYELPNMDGYRSAAVGIICFPNPKNEMSFLLIERPVYQGVHSGQMAFPGGKKDLEDSDLLCTAIREVKEEVGVLLFEEQCLLEMTEMIIPVSQFTVQPYLFFMDVLPQLIPDEREVSLIVEATLGELMQESTLQVKDIKLSTNQWIKEVPYFDLAGKHVWGATAIILSELKAIFQ